MLALRLLAPLVGGLVVFLVALAILRQAARRLLRPYSPIIVALLRSSRPGAVLGGALVSLECGSPRRSLWRLAAMVDCGALSIRLALAASLGLVIMTAALLQVLVFNLAAAGAYIAAAGLLLMLFSRGVVRHAGRAALGVGLVFVGYHLMKAAPQSLFNYGEFERLKVIVDALSLNPFYAFLAGAALAALLGSPLAAIALALAFNLPVAPSIAYALGTSIGGAIPGLAQGIFGFAAMRGPALGSLLSNLVGASLFMAALGRLSLAATRITAPAGAGADRTIAVAYGIYALLQAIIFIPLVPVIREILLSTTGGARTTADRHRRPAHEVDLEAAAFGVAKTGRRVLDMLRKTLSAFLVATEGVAADIRAQGRLVAVQIEAVSGLLRQVETEKAAPRREKVRLLDVLDSLRETRRLVVVRLLRQALDKSEKGADFSVEQAHHFEQLHRLVADDLQEALDVVEGQPGRPERIRENAAAIEKMVAGVIASHLRRIEHKVAADEATSDVFTDAVSALRSIHYKACDIIRTS